MPFWAAAIADWVLVHASWPVVAAGVGAVAVLLVARALGPSAAKTGVGALAVWISAGLVSDGLDRLGALGTITLAPVHAAGVAIGIDLAAALAVTMMLLRRPPPLDRRSLFVVVPCVVVLAAGPPDAIRATLEPGLANGGARRRRRRRRSAPAVARLERRSPARLITSCSCHATVAGSPWTRVRYATSR